MALNSLSLIVFLATICFAAVAHADSSHFDRTLVVQALGLYGNKANGLAQYSPLTCGGPVGAGLPAAAQDLVSSTFSSRYAQYFRTAGQAPLDFTIGGSSFLGPIANRSVLLSQLVEFYQIIFGSAFSQPNHWLYSTPTIDFTPNNHAFGGADTALVTVENESRAFVCNPTLGRVFQVYFNTFSHVFCWEDHPGHVNDAWKICGFFENNKGIFVQNATLYTQLFP